MSEIDALHGGLARLVYETTHFIGKERVLAKAGETDLRDAMRKEISETQLLRRVIFRNDLDEEVSFDVVSGRVLQLSTPTSPDLFTDTPVCMHGAAQGDGIPVEVDAGVLHCIIARFLTSATSLWVETQRLENGGTPTQVGISLDALFQPAPIAPPSSGSGQNLIAFVKASEDVSTAGLVMAADSRMWEQGPEANVAMLEGLAKAEMTRFQSKSGSVVSKCFCVIFSGHPSGGTSVLCGSQEGCLALLSFEDHGHDKLLQLWITHTKD